MKEQPGLAAATRELCVVDNSLNFRTLGLFLVAMEILKLQFGVDLKMLECVRVLDTLAGYAGR